MKTPSSPSALSPEEKKVGDKIQDNNGKEYTISRIHEWGNFQDWECVDINGEIFSLRIPK